MPKRIVVGALVGLLAVLVAVLGTRRFPGGPSVRVSRARVVERGADPAG